MRNSSFTLALVLLSVFNLFAQKVGDAYRLNINNIDLPLDRSGVIADVNVPPSGTGGRFDGYTFLFSGGFFLSGYSDTSLWANAVASASHVRDYVPGSVENGSSDPNAVMYVISQNDQPFSTSWQHWRDAVELGADFYDGDGDGFYNPVDLNSNGIWDPNEDAPDLLGDRTVWCIYNDGMPSHQRRWNAVEPLGIEIRQTAFAYANAQIGNIIFFRYRIKYVGLGAANEPDRLQDVYFGAWADPDIGENYYEDLVGSDVPRNSIFTYKSNPDPSYGNNPPSFFTTFNSGPIEYIPGVTFVDINGNGTYDPGIDEPIDTAIIRRGQLLGEDIFPGARNQPLSSVIEYLNGYDPAYNDPDDHIRARNYMLGLTYFGQIADPCTFPIGEVRGGVDCSTVNPYFWFSGDPVTNVGWIGIRPWDVRQMANTGPFTLYKDTPQNREDGQLIEKEIIVAYVVGRGTNRITSITTARGITDIASLFFNSNFNPNVLTIKDNDEGIIAGGYILSQNYPNPFNPSTFISWQSPVGSLQSLRVFDVLGREVATLVNEYKEAGTHSVEFNAAGLPSGVYFYRLNVGSFSETKKMILLR